MIRVCLQDGADTVCEGVVRSVTSQLEPDTAFSRSIELAAGPAVSGRLGSLGELPVGAAVITPGGDLDESFIIHVVLQSSEDPVRTEALRTALGNALRRAQEWGLDTLALPSLGTGAGNLEAEESARAMVSVIHGHMQDHRHPREVVLLVPTEYERGIFLEAVERSPARARARDN